MSLELALKPTTDSAAAVRRADRDHDLLDALRRRDAAAAERLITRYGERAYRLASRIIGNGQDAEEVVQDAFWAVIRKIDSFRGESAFGSWLYRIVANAAYHKLRRGERRWHDISLEEVLPRFDGCGRYAGPVADWSPQAADPAMQTELRTALSAALDELSATHRAVLVLRDVEGRSIAEIADALGLTTGGVKSRAHRARLCLRKRLGQHMTALDATTVTRHAS